MKKITISYIVMVTGILLFATGLILVKTVNNPEDIMLALPYICIGYGCGAFSFGLSNIINDKTLRNRPDLRKQKEISEKDERNITIEHSAKAKAYDIMVFVFGALLLSYSLMGIDMIAILLLVFSYLLVIFLSLYYRIKFEKNM